jgi:hypothetical protein
MHVGEGNVLSSPNSMDVAIGFIAAAQSLAGSIVGRTVDAVIIVTRIA